MKIQKLIIIVLFFSFCFLLSTQLSFAPVSDDVEPEEVIRAIKIQREEAREVKRVRKAEREKQTQRIRQEEIRDALEEVEAGKKTKSSSVAATAEDREEKGSSKFWFIMIAVVALGFFILSRIKPSSKK